MNKINLIFFFFAAILISSCSNGQSNEGFTTVTPQEFSKKLAKTPEAFLIDVRTPGEYADGHLQDAVNIDWKSNDFGEKVADIDKSAPIYVYCLSGGRSKGAANFLKKEGFENVIEMDGGMMKWRSLKMPETKEASSLKTAGMSLKQFEALLATDKVVLVDFYADWCKPCKKMEPYLKEIDKDMGDKVTVLRIDADQNPELCSQMNVNALPTIMVYKNKVQTWKNVGFVDKAAVLEKL
jgi:thioredoxin 1